MKVIERNLFNQVSCEESATVSGGDATGYLNYINLARTPASPGGVGLTAGEIQTGWDILIGVLPFSVAAPTTPVAVTPVAATPVAVIQPTIA